MDARAGEARHRVLVRMGIGLLLVVSVVPATGHVGRAAAPLVERCREILAQCALVLRSTGAPLQWLPVALLAVGLVYALIDRVRLSAKLARVLAAHRARAPRADEPVGRLAREFGLDARVSVLVGPAPNPAFTAGLLRPRIFVSARLQRTLTPGELRAVVRHEWHHLLRRDPLRFAVLRFASKTFFWLPLIRVLADDLAEQAEIMADDFATSAGGGSDPLDAASALVKIGRANARVLAGTVGIGGFRLLDRRVRRLADEPVAVTFAMPPRPALLSAGVLLALWLASTFAPPHASAGMTMQWGERCPHSMQGAPGHCPECEERRDGPMRDCPA